MDLLGAVAGDIVPQLEGIGKVIAGALLGIAVAVVADTGAQGQVQPQLHQIRLHRELPALRRGSGEANQTQQVADAGFFHAEAVHAAQGIVQRDGALAAALWRGGQGQRRRGGLSGQQIFRPQPHPDTGQRQRRSVLHLHRQGTGVMGHAGLRRVQRHGDAAAGQQRQHDTAQGDHHQRRTHGQCRGGPGQHVPQRGTGQTRQPHKQSRHGHFSCTWGIFTVFTISAVTSAADSRCRRALALSTRRWQHTSSNTAATSSGIT